MTRFTATAAGDCELRYLDAAHVDGPLPQFAGVDLLGTDHETIGRVDGILVNPRRRHADFLVVARQNGLRRRRYLLPVSEICVEQGGSLALASPRAMEDLDEFDPAEFPAFSDEDLIAALFSDHEAA